MSKYDALWRYIQVNCGPHETMTFNKAEEVCDVPIDPSFNKAKDELIEYGYKIEHVSWKHEEFEIRML